MTTLPQISRAPAPLGHVEPYRLLLTQPRPGQRLFKVMRAEHLIQSIEGEYLHFNRIDQYADFPLADAHDGAELPQDRAINQIAFFEKAPTFSLSDYYARSRERTYACCFSLENSDHIWTHYGVGSAMGRVGLEFDFEKLRHRLNEGLLGSPALMCDGIRCHQIFSINYGEVEYVDQANHRASSQRTANPIQYAYLKDTTFAGERELRITLSVIGMGRFVLADGKEIEFPPTLQLAFDFRGAISDGTIVQVWHSPTTDTQRLTDELARLGISGATSNPTQQNPIDRPAVELGRQGFPSSP